MKFTIDHDIFGDALSRVQGVCAQKSTLPILASCLIEAHTEGYLTIQGTDLDVSITTRCPADVDQPGRVALTAKRLYETVKSVSAKQVTLSVEANHWAVLDADRIHARIAGSHPEEFPQLPGVDESMPLTLPGGALLDMIDKTFFSISTDEARASFTGAYFRVTDEGTFQVVSTDGHRLSKIENVPQGFEPDAAPEALRKGIIVPRKGLAEFRRVFDKASPVAIGIKGDDLLAKGGDTTVAVRLIPGRFPNFSQVIPRELDHRVTIERAALHDALKRASIYTAKTGNTRISLSTSTLEVYAFDPEAGELNEPIPCSYDGGGVSAGFNYRYLLDVINVIEGDEMGIDLIDTESPTVVHDSARDDVLYIVMPMQF